MTGKPGMVTVLTPVYNGASFIAETVDSVLSQGWPELEYIVLDDGSTDDTLQVLRRFGDRIRVLSQQNMGETRTVNKGLGLAQGEFVAIVNADDPLRPGAIAAAVAALRQHPDALLAYPDWAETDPRGQVLREVRLPQYDLRTMLSNFNVAMGPGVFLRRRALDAVGLRDVSLKYAGDIDLWFRLAMHGQFVHLPEILATHRVHPASASVSDRGGRMADEVVRVARKCCDDPRLPTELSLQRGVILSRAHFEASFYCGRDWGMRLSHLLRSVRYAPLFAPLIVARHLLYRAAVATPAPVREALRRLLGRDRIPRQ